MSAVERLRRSTLLRFAIAGLVTNVVYAAALLLARSSGAEWWLAATIAYLVSVVVNYALQRGFTFRARGSHAATGWKYLVTQGVCLSCNAAVVQAVAGQLRWHPLIAQGCSVAATLAISYLLLSHWVFAERPRDRPLPTP